MNPITLSDIIHRADWQAALVLVLLFVCAVSTGYALGYCTGLADGMRSWRRR